MSPVADAYGKPDLAPGTHRLAMCAAATSGMPAVMVDAWEARQEGYTRTLQVLRHVRDELAAAVTEGTVDQVPVPLTPSFSRPGARPPA